MRGLTRLFYCAGEAVSKDHVRSGSFAVGERLEHHVVAALRERRAVPRPMEGDECAPLVGRRELLSIINQEVIGRPMPREDRYRGSLVGTQPDRLAAVPAILWSKDEPVLG